MDMYCLHYAVLYNELVCTGVAMQIQKLQGAVPNGYHYTLQLQLAVCLNFIASVLATYYN